MTLTYFFPSHIDRRPPDKPPARPPDRRPPENEDNDPNGRFAVTGLNTSDDDDDEPENWNILLRFSES